MSHMVSRERLAHTARTCSLRASHLLASLIFRRQLASVVSPDVALIISDLETEGVHVTTVDRLVTDGRRRIVDAASRLLGDEAVRQNPALWVRATSSTDLTADALLARVPELYLLGLDAHILRVAQQYLKLPVAYHGAVFRHSLVDGELSGPRLWHQDAEDFHVLRMVVYLNDVAAGGGPFEYIPRSLGVTYRDFHGCSDHLTDDQVERVVPRDRWKRVAGPTGTVVLCDTAKVFHRESIQTERERSVIMIGYSSRRPSGMDLAMAHFPVERLAPAMLKIVPAINHGHVFGWRRAAEPDTVPLPSSA